jgi:CubicO group peptidase (beta-lactamase class C family)
MQIRHFQRGGAAIVAAGLMLLSMLGVSPQAHAQDAFSDTIGTYIDGTIEAQMALGDIPAVTVSVVKDGQVIFAKGYGYADLAQGTPVDPDTSLFRIGSTSKLFTWLAVMQLYEQGKVDLDADVNSYLEFTIPATYEKAITLRHILSHTAGFEEGGLGYLIKHYPNMGPELAEAMAKYVPQRVNPPGEVSSYSNYATALAGLIVQNVSGVPFNDYIEQNIFAPLGMSHTTFAEPLPEHLSEHMVTGYSRKLGVFSELPFEVINSFGPAGAVSSSATDMAKFMLANLNNGELDGQRILSAETTELMHSLLFSGDARIRGMAYGYYEKDYNGHRVVGHGGDTQQFHTDMAVDKGQNIGIFVSYMTTVSNAARNQFVKQIYNHFFPRELETLTPPSDFAERAGKYAGNYIFWRRNVSTIEKAFGLMSSGISVSPSADNTLIVAGPFGARQFVEVDDNLFRQVDGPDRIAFASRSGDAIDTFYYESLPFMGIQRTPWFESSFYKLLLPGLSLLLFLQIIISWFYRRRDYKAASSIDKAMAYSSLGMGISHLLFLILLVTVFVSYQDTIYRQIPSALGWVLVVPFISILFTAFVVWAFVKRLQAGQAGWASNIYYGFVVAAGLFMLVFYNYWNLIGWKYHS